MCLADCSHQFVPGPRELPLQVPASQHLCRIVSLPPGNNRVLRKMRTDFEMTTNPPPTILRNRFASKAPSIEKNFKTEKHICFCANRMVRSSHVFSSGKCRRQSATIFGQIWIVNFATSKAVSTPTYFCIFSPNGGFGSHFQIRSIFSRNPVKCGFACDEHEQY